MLETSEIERHLGKCILDEEKVTVTQLKTLIESSRQLKKYHALHLELQVLCNELLTMVYLSPMGRNEFRKVLDEMDGLSDVTQALNNMVPERKNPANASQTEQRQANHTTGQPRAKDGSHGSGPAGSASGVQSRATANGNAVPVERHATVGKGHA